MVFNGSVTNRLTAKRGVEQSESICTRKVYLPVFEKVTLMAFDTRHERSTSQRDRTADGRIAARWMSKLRHAGSAWAVNE